MAENVNGEDLFGSGGHVWVWGEPPQVDKVLRTPGIIGAMNIKLLSGEWPVAIRGRNGGPALLRAGGATRADADAAMTALEDAIELLRETAAECTWEDDQGHTGSALVIKSFSRSGPRRYGREGTDWTCWQYYVCSMVELTGYRT